MIDRPDTMKLFDATAAIPEQVESAVSYSGGLEGLPSRERVEHVVFIGTGDGGMGGEVLRAASGAFLPVPIVVVKGYELPAFVGEGSLVFATSYSGETEETIEAATVAATQGASIVAITGGGELAKLAASWGSPVIEIPDTIPDSRTALGATAIPPIVILEEIGLYPGAGQWLDLAVEQLKRRRDDVVAGTSPVQEIARTIGRTIPLVHGGGFIGAAAAMRWKNAINMSAKAPAFWSNFPEVTHNEIAGWGQHGDVTRQVFSLVNLRHDAEHPQVSRTFELAAEALRETVGPVIEVEAQGEGELAQLLDLVLVGDFVALQMAAQEGIDPGPVPAIEALKSALARQ